MLPVPEEWVLFILLIAFWCDEVGSAPGSDQSNEKRKRLSVLTSYDNQLGKRAQTVRKRGETISSRDPKKLGHQAMCMSPHLTVSRRAVDRVFPSSKSSLPVPISTRSGLLMPPILGTDVTRGGPVDT